MAETEPAGGPGARPVRTLEDLLCFDLYAASRAVTACYRPLLTDLGLTYPQYLVLVALQPEERLTVGELAAALSLDRGTVTPLLRRMESAGLVSRRCSDEDERRVEVLLTPAAEALRARLGDVQCAVTEAMGLTTAEFVGMQHSLRTMAEAVRAASGSRRS